MYSKLAEYQEKIPGKLIRFQNRFGNIKNISDPFQLIDLHHHHQAMEDAQKQIQYSGGYQRPLQMYHRQKSKNIYSYQEEQFKREAQGRLEQNNYYQEKQRKKSITNDSDDEQQKQFPFAFTKYKIIPAKDEKMALDVTSIEDKKLKMYAGNLIVWQYHGGSNQHFYLKRIQMNQYKSDKNIIPCLIINASTGFLLDAIHTSNDATMPLNTNFRRADKNQIVMNPAIERRVTPTQIWLLQKCGYDLYFIRALDGRVLDVMHSDVKNGAPVITYIKKQTQGKNQKWRIWPS